MSRLDQVSRFWMLRNAVRMVSRARKEGVPLWSIVAEVCSVGSNSAVEICEEMGWEPHSPATQKLPEA